jgi:hypothetical protein
MLTWGWYPYVPPSRGGLSWRMRPWAHRWVSRMTSSAGRSVPASPEREALLEAAHLELQTARQAKLDAPTPELHGEAIAKCDAALDVLLELRGR